MTRTFLCLIAVMSIAPIGPSAVHAQAPSPASPVPSVIDSLLDAGQWARAVGLLDRRLADTPTPSLYAQRGRAHRELGALALSRRDYDAAVALDSTFGGAYAGRAATRHYATDPRGALGDIALARRFGVSAPSLTLLEGMAYSTQDSVTASLAAFERYVNEVPADPVGWYLRGFTNGKDGRHPAAVADLTRAITLRMPGPNAYRYRALSFIALGNTAEACADGAAAALGDRDAAALVRQHCR